MPVGRRSDFAGKRAAAHDPPVVRPWVHSIPLGQPRQQRRHPLYLHAGPAVRGDRHPNKKRCDRNLRRSHRPASLVAVWTFVEERADPISKLLFSGESVAAHDPPVPASEPHVDRGDLGTTRVYVLADEFNMRVHVRSSKQHASGTTATIVNVDRAITRWP